LNRQRSCKSENKKDNQKQKNTKFVFNNLDGIDFNRRLLTFNPQCWHPNLDFYGCFYDRYLNTRGYVMFYIWVLLGIPLLYLIYTFVEFCVRGEYMGIEKKELTEIFLNSRKKWYAELDVLNMQYVKMLFTTNGGGTIAVLALIAQLHATEQSGLATQMVFSVKLFVSGLLATIISTAFRIFRQVQFINLDTTAIEDADRSFLPVYRAFTIIIYFSYAWGLIAFGWGVLDASSVLTSIP